MTGLVDTSRPYATAAADYLPTGLGVPVPIDGKILRLSGVTGEHGEAGPADVDRWLDHHGTKNLGLILDETVVAIDVDHGYTGHDGRVKHGAETIAAYEAALGPLPPTVSSTSRGDQHPESRVRFYRVTAADGAALRHSVDLRADGEIIPKRPDGTTRGDVEVIHHRYRYVAVWPSVHPDTGNLYRWYAPDGTPLDRLPAADFDLPDLPERWARHLVAKAVARTSGTAGRPATRAEVDALLTDGTMHPELQELARRFWTEEIAHGNGIEDESDLLGMTSRLARLTVNQVPGSRTAVDLCRAGYVRAPYGEDPYGHAFDAALAGSITFWTRRRAEDDVIRGALFPTTDGDDTVNPGDSLQASPGGAVAPGARDASPSGGVTPAPSTADGWTVDPATSQVVADPTPEPDQPAEPTEYQRLHEQEVARELERRLVRADVDRIIAEKAAPDELPRKVRLDRFLDEPDTDPTWRFVDLWPTGGNVLLTAPAKSGKSTMVGNILRSLADGEPFLGRHDVQPAKVVVVDDELDERSWRRNLRDVGVDNGHAVDVVSLRGRLGTFNVLDPATRARWADHLRGVDVLIFDCLRPALDALGVSERDDAGRFIVALDALKAEAGISEMLVVHHTGHDQQGRPRGDSRLKDWPDVLWSITPQDDGQPLSEDTLRDFDANGRDVSVKRTQLLYDTATRRLTLADQDAWRWRQDETLAWVVATVTATPGVSSRALEQGAAAAGYKRADVRRAVENAERQGRIYPQDGPKRSKAWYPLGTA